MRTVSCVRTLTSILTVVIGSLILPAALKLHCGQYSSERCAIKAQRGDTFLMNCCLDDHCRLHGIVLLAERRMWAFEVAS